MTWAFTDDHANEDELWVELGGAAAWYYTMGDAYCRRREPERLARGARLDVIPRKATLTLFPDEKAAEHVAAFVRHGLWKEEADAYVVAGYMRKYHSRRDQQEAASPPKRAGSVGPPNVSQLGGRARASTAQRDGSGRFQPKPSQPVQPPPATRPSDPESGSRSSSSESTPPPKDLTGYGDQPDQPEGGGLGIRERAELFISDPTKATMDYGMPQTWAEVRAAFQAFQDVWSQPAEQFRGRDDPRARRIVERFAEGFTDAQLVEAARGARLDPHIASNPQWQDVATVWRDAGQVEKFRRLLTSPPKPSRRGPPQPSTGGINLKDYGG